MTSKVKRRDLNQDGLSDFVQARTRGVDWQTTREQMTSQEPVYSASFTINFVPHTAEHNNACGVIFREFLQLYCTATYRNSDHAAK